MSRSSASRSSSSPAGMPSTIATSPGPCDSPAVVNLNAVIGRQGYRRAARSVWRPMARQMHRAARSTAGGGAHDVDRGLPVGPDLEGDGALLDEDLDAVDGRRTGGGSGGQQR